MPRRARVVEVNVPLHIRQRGNNRQTCFQRDVDYIVYLGWLAEYAQASGCQVHAYVLMSNHVHILASFNDVTGPALLMKGLAQRYSQYFNWWYERTGTVWEGRYRSSLVLDERYFLTCQRYVELNPVRAGMVAIPEQYRWSSYRGNAGMRPDDMLTSHACYESLGATVSERQAVYRSLFDTELAPSLVEEIRTATRTNAALGGPPVKRGRPKKR
ncbi:transposase [Pseudoduganella buxea]|uniref:transposase n=1 Tax=Pseudoduganella buxea TaxID=1949069 RepID=UPI001E53143A|nr:transposase [Pseudoduganella buxea]